MKNLAHLFSKLLFALPVWLFCLSAAGQDKARTSTVTAQSVSPVQQLAATIDNFNNTVPVEKIYLQTDRPYYTNIDTIWLKAYILDADLSYTKQSGLLYTELLDDSSQVVLRECLPVRDGLSFSQMALDEKTVPEGSYTLRAYTNWMQNQGTASFFTQRIYIGAANSADWLIGKATHLSVKNGVNELSVSMQLNKAENGTPLILQNLAVKVVNGNKTLVTNRLKTDMGGKMDFSFNLPALKLTSPYVVLSDADNRNSHKLIIPLEVNRQENIDLQFMPEGGNIMAGLPANIGFKAIGENGKGVNVAGNIFDSKGNTVAAFRSSHLGMGVFSFTPLPGEKYMASVNGTNKTFPLPVVAPSGVVLHVIDPADKDSIIVKVMASDDVMASGQKFSLVAVSGSKVCYAANLALEKGMVVGAVDKARFRSGIVHFTVFNDRRQPVAERLIFIDHNDRLNIQVKSTSIAYHPRDSIILQLMVTGQDHKPVQGSFSLAVTDDQQVKIDSNTITGITAAMLLTDDLKGNIEDAAYYFNPKNPDRFACLDNLLLTQGWIGYDWKNVFDPKYHLLFKPQPEIAVTGNVTRTGGKSLSGLQVILLSPKKPVLLLDQKTDENGAFAFRNLPQIDTANFLVSVKDKKGKMFEANINIDEFKAADATGLDNSPLQPWYVNTDTTLLNYMNSSRAYSKMVYDLKFPAGSKVLKEVNIKAVKRIKGSHFFAGYGAEPDQVLDETDMRKANKMTIEELLEKKVKGFVAGPWPCGKMPVSLEYMIDCLPVTFSIDGFMVDEFYVQHPGYMDHYAYLHDYIGLFTAEDVRGIEIKGEATYSIIEITTWSGNGAFMHRVHNQYLYRPMPITWPKNFYQPKYSPKNDNKMADLRPTLLWEPNIITDTAGKAVIWFGAKIKAGSYRGIINGSDLGGHVGSSTFTIKTK